MKSRNETVWSIARSLIAGLLLAHVLAYAAALFIFGASPNNTFLLRYLLFPEAGQSDQASR